MRELILSDVVQSLFKSLKRESHLQEAVQIERELHLKSRETFARIVVELLIPFSQLAFNEQRCSHIERIVV